MDHLKAVAAGLVILSGIGAIMFFIFRLLLRRVQPATLESPAVSPREILKASLVVSAGLVLIWFKEMGGSFAAIVFSIVIVGLQIYGMIVLNIKKMSSE